MQGLAYPKEPVLGQCMHGLGRHCLLGCDILPDVRNRLLPWLPSWLWSDAPALQGAGPAPRDGMDDDGGEDDGGDAVTPRSLDKKGGKAGTGSTGAYGDAGGSGLPNNGIDRLAHTCSLVLTLPLSSPKLLMLEIVERTAAATLVRATPGIDKVYVVDAPPQVSQRGPLRALPRARAWVCVYVCTVCAFYGAEGAVLHCIQFQYAVGGVSVQEQGVGVGLAP